MWETYKSCIRVIIIEYLPKVKNFEYKPTIDYLLNQADDKGTNFDPITTDFTSEEII